MEKLEQIFLGSTIYCKEINNELNQDMLYSLLESSFKIKVQKINKKYVLIIQEDSIYEILYQFLKACFKV